MKDFRLTKSLLAVRLSGLKGFSYPVIGSEQYCTDSETAADILWNAFMKGDVSGKKVLDLGCGTGILGIGSLILGSEKTVFVDHDLAVLDVLKENLASLNFSERYEIVHAGLDHASFKADTVIMNPPFGTRKKHADREFLLKAFESAGVVYSVHKSSSLSFLSKISADNGFRMTDSVRFDLHLRKTYDFHRKRVARVEAVWARFSRVF